MPMKINLSVISLMVFLLLSIISSDEVKAMDNGIYLLSANKKGKTIKTVDGVEPGIGKKTNYTIRKGCLSSNGNDNCTFSLTLYMDYDKKLESSDHVLIVDDNAIRQSGSGYSQNVESDIYFIIPGEALALQVAKHLKITPRYRAHPEHRLLAEFVPDKRDYKKGDDVIVTLRIKNIGKDAVSFQVGGMNRAARDNQYMFNAYKNGWQVNDVGTISHFGGLSANRILKKGEVFENKISLKKWFKLDEEGYYTIQGSYHMTYYDPENTQDHFIRWQDFVTGEFYFNVK